jgi:hypothetical protein
MKVAANSGGAKRHLTSRSAIDASRIFPTARLALGVDCAAHNLSVGSPPMTTALNRTAREGVPLPAGIEQTGVIDFFAHDTKRDEIVLAMHEPRAWDGSESQLFQLQEKFNAYVSFLLDGELAETHPELIGKNARIELRCVDVPSGRVLDLLSAIHDQLALQDIRVEVIVQEPGCTCGKDGCCT